MNSFLVCTPNFLGIRGHIRLFHTVDELVKCAIIALKLLDHTACTSHYLGIVYPKNAIISKSSNNVTLRSRTTEPSIHNPPYIEGYIWGQLPVALNPRMKACMLGFNVHTSHLQVCIFEHTAKLSAWALSSLAQPFFEGRVFSFFYVDQFWKSQLATISDSLHSRLIVGLVWSLVHIVIDSKSGNKG